MKDEPSAMFPPPSSAKEARFQAVASAVVALTGEEGVDGVQYAAVARRAGVSRAWLYKYFGGDRQALVAFAARTVGDAFAEHHVVRGEDDLDSWRDGIVTSTRRGLDDAADQPTMVLLWFRYRHASGVAGDAVREVERRHVGKFVDDMPEALRQDRAAAQRFAALFASARLGAYHLWVDPSFRETCDIEDVIELLMSMLDGWVESRR